MKVARRIVALSVTAFAVAVGCGGGTDLGLGDPCSPDIQSAPSFTGFSLGEVAIEGNSAACGSRTCLVNHFQGLVRDPYEGIAQCRERRAERAVYCSCRCANVDGRTDDGENYCECPDAFECKMIAPPITGSDRRGGSYCIKRGTAYAQTDSCTPCDRAKANCP